MLKEKKMKNLIYPENPENQKHQKQKKQKKRNLTVALFMALFLFSCGSDEPDDSNNMPDNAPELVCKAESGINCQEIFLTNAGSGCPAGLTESTGRCEGESQATCDDGAGVRQVYFGYNASELAGEQASCEEMGHTWTPSSKTTPGVNVTPNGGITTESGDEVTLSLVLTSQPAADVTITPVSSDNGEGTVSGALTFTPSNWNTQQQVTVTGQDDNLADGTQTYQINFTVSSGDTSYDGLQLSPVEMMNTDDEMAGVTRIATDTTTDESGATGTISVVLNTPVTADVTITPASSDMEEGTVSEALTFTPSNWNVQQTITVTGVDDRIDDGDQTYQITFAVSSPGTSYDGLSIDQVEMTNTDDDIADIAVDATDATTSESGATGTISVVLETQPTADVTITPASRNTGEGTVIGALTFTPSSWNVQQTITVTGVDDETNDGNQTYEITFAVSSSDTNYDGLSVNPVEMTNTDNDTPGITVMATDTTTSESGATGTISVELNTQPTADVTITPASSDDGEGTVSRALTFTPANWNTQQQVTVTGQDDNIVDGTQNYQITFTVSSTDTEYNVLTIRPVNVTNTDNDTGGVTLTPSGSETTESGGVVMIGVVLTSQPTADVTITPASSDTGEGTVSPETLTFTPSEWSTEQEVTVTGVNDDIADGDQMYQITFTVSSTDTIYNGLIVSPVDLTNADNDTANIMQTAIGSETSESGGTVTISMVLTSEPTADVKITPASSDTGEGTVSPETLTFTPSNWNTQQTITVTGVGDGINDPNESYQITFTVSSDDTNYGAITISPVDLTNTSVMASYDAEATPATADATVASGKRRVHAPFPFDTPTTGSQALQPYVVYVTVNIWTLGSCSNPSIAEEAACRASPGETWTAASCSDGVSTTQEACEPLPTVDTSSAKWAPMTFSNDDTAPYSIWVADIPTGDNIRFAFFIGQGGGTNEATHRPNLVGAFGRLANDAYREFTGSDVVSGSAVISVQGGNPFEPWRDPGLEPYFSGALSGKPDCSSNDPSDANFCLPLKINPPGDDTMKYVYMGFLFDTGGDTITIRYTTDGTEPSSSRGTEATVAASGSDENFYAGIKLFNNESNRVWRASLPDNEMLKFTVYIDRDGGDRDGRLSRRGYQEDGTYTEDSRTSAAFRSTDCQTTMQAARVAQEYRLCNANNARPITADDQITAKYDPEATPATAGAAVTSGKRRVHAPFLFDTTGFQAYVVYVTSGTWTAGICSDGVSTTRAACEAVTGETWTAASCSDGVSTTQEACESLPTINTASTSWAPMTFSNDGTAPYSIWVADIPEGENIRFAFFISRGGGTDEETHRTNLAGGCSDGTSATQANCETAGGNWTTGAFGRLANDAYREYSESDVICGAGSGPMCGDRDVEGSVFKDWGNPGLETYFSGAMACSTGDPTMANFCLPLKDSAPDGTAADMSVIAMKYVYLGFLFDTDGDTITIRYTTDGTEPAEPSASEMGTTRELPLTDMNFYAGINLSDSRTNWTWRASLPDNEMLKFTVYIDTDGDSDTDGRLSRRGYDEAGSYPDYKGESVAFDNTDCQTTMQSQRIAQEYRLCNAINQRTPTVPVMASYDGDATGAGAAPVSGSDRRRVHAPFPFATTGLQPFVAYVTVNTWTPASCTGGMGDTQTVCETDGGTWTAASCSDSSLTTREACEPSPVPLPTRNTASAEWAPMTFSNSTTAPYYIWVADIPTGDNIRFAFFIGQGGGTNEATHKPNLARAFGRLANDAYREFTASDVISGEGGTPFTFFNPDDGPPAEPYFSGALSGRPDCSSNDPANDNFCLPLKVSPASGMKYVYLGFLFDTTGNTITIRYTTDGSAYEDVTAEFYGGLDFFGSVAEQENRIWRASLPDNANLKYTVYIGNTGAAQAFGRLSRRGYQEGSAFSADDADNAMGVAFDNTDCQTTMQSQRIAQEYRLCNAMNVRP